MKKIVLFLLIVSVFFSFQSEAQVVTQIGSGTTTNTTTSYPAPFGNYWWGARHQQLYTAAELTSAGLTAGAIINDLGFKVVGAAQNQQLDNFEMKIAGVTNTTLTTAWVTGTATVFGPANYTPTTGTNLFTLSAPWVWNGTDNLLVETCFNNGSFNNNEVMENTAIANMSNHYRADATGVCANAASTGLNTSRANLVINYLPPGSCLPPIGLSATNIMPTSATLGWVDTLNAMPAMTYDIELLPATAPPSGTPTATGITTTSYNQTMLTPSTSYDFYVRGHCSATDTSIWIGPFTFTTIASCAAPTALSATSVAMGTSITATLDWTENNMPAVNNWDLILGLSGTVPTPTATSTPTIPGITTKPYSIPGLPENTCFDYYVRTNCGAGTSLWVGPFTFCTPILPLSCASGSPTIVYQEEFTNTFTFQTNIPNAAAPGWTNTATANPRWALESNATGSATTGPNFGAQGSSGYAYLEVSCVSGGTDTLTSPAIDLTAATGAARVKWFNHMYGPNSGALELFIDDGTTVTSVWSDSGQTQASSAAPWDSAVVNLNAYVGSTINLVFVGTAANPGGCSGDRGIDQIEVEACLPQLVDMAADTITAPVDMASCYTATETIDVQISNASLSTIDFSVDSVLVTVDITGATTATLTEWVTTGTLAGNATQIVTMTTPVDMTTAGAYNISAYVTVMGDTDSLNDTTANVAVYMAGAGAGSIGASPDVLCVSGTTDVSFSGLPGVTVQYQEAAAATGPWTNVGTGGTMYTSGTLTATTYYRALFSCNGTTDTTNVDTVIVNNPMMLTSMGDTICGADTATLMATATSATINWYDAATGGNLLDTGGVFNPFVTVTDTFYVAPLDGAGKLLITGVCNFNNATGWLAPTAPVPAAVQDPLEFTNIGTAPLDVSGWKVEVTGGAAGSFTFPAGAIVAPNSTVVLGRGTSAGPDVAGQYYQAPTLPTTSSGVALGVIVSDAAATVQDVMSYSGFAVVGTGTPAATAADWTGTTVGGGGTAGWIRTGLDDTNDASDWTVASATNTISYGALNAAYTPAGCEGTRTAVIVVSTPATPITASSDTTVCWDGSVTVPLTATSTNTAYTYTWSPATGLNTAMGATVNANPTVATQYVVTGVDATGCGNTDTVNIAVVDSFTTTASVNPGYICGSDSAEISAMTLIPPYCASNATNGFDTKIDTVTFAGVSIGSPTTGQETYTDYTATVIPVTAGVALPLAIRNGASGTAHYASYVKVFIDYNQDGTYAASEEVYAWGNTTAFNTIPATTVTIPTTALNGMTGMRVVLRESGSATTTLACGTFTYGETEDYMLDISGGSAAPVFNYAWMPGMLMGDTVVVTPAGTTTYTVTQTDGFGCSSSDSVVVNVNAVSGILSQATASNAASTTGTQNQTYPQMDGTTINYYDPSCNLIVTVNDGMGGNVLGSTVSDVTIDATVQNHNGQPYTRRWFEITPTSDGPATVTIYQTQADFDDYNVFATANGWPLLPTGPTDAAGIANARVTQISGGTLGVGTPTQHTPATIVWDATDLHWELTFPVTGFSEFYTHTVNPGNVVLPVTLTEFTVTKDGSVSLAAWITSSERNNSHFNLQRSVDGNDFTTLGKVNTKSVDGNSTTELSYNFTDVAPQIGHNYYRLEQVDQDGQMSYSEIVDVVWGADGSVVTIYPNPATDNLNVDVSTDKVSQIEVRLVDMSGRVIQSVMQKTAKGMNNVSLDLSTIANGIYGVQILENNNLIHTSKVNKQDK